MVIDHFLKQVVLMTVEYELVLDYLNNQNHDIVDHLILLKRKRFRYIYIFRK